MEAHLKQLKKQHASQLQGMQSLLDNQSDQIDSLLADQQSLKTQCTQSKCEADAATGQLNSVKQKLTSVKQEADAERQEKMQLQASVHELQQASHKTTQAMAAAADRESNLHQQIHTLKSQLADTSKEQELQGLHDQLELKDQELARLQAQVQADAAKDSQRQSLLDTISKQQQDLQQQASDVHELHSQAQANDSKQQQRTEQLAAQQALIGQLQSEIVHHKGKFAAQQAASDAQLQEAVMKSAQLDANQQQLAELQHAMSEQQALHLNSQQAIAALQEHVSKDALTATASQSRLQMLTDQLEVQHEVLDQEKQKLQAALHNAAAAQEAALRLQNRLSEQQSQTADQQQEYSQAVHADSATMAQLQASVTVMQGKVHAADQAIAAHREQAHAQAKKTDTAQEQLQTMIQELALKTTAVDSLQIALQAANTNTDLHTTLVSSLQEAADEQEEMAAAMTRTWQRQLDKLTAQNTSLSTEVQSLHSKLAVANQTIALLEESSQAAATHDKFSSLPNTALCGPVLQDSTNRYSTAGLPTVTYKDI